MPYWWTKIIEGDWPEQQKSEERRGEEKMEESEREKEGAKEASSRIDRK